MENPDRPSLDKEDDEKKTPKKAPPAGGTTSTTATPPTMIPNDENCRTTINRSRNPNEPLHSEDAPVDMHHSAVANRSSVELLSPSTTGSANTYAASLKTSLVDATVDNNKEQHQHRFSTSSKELAHHEPAMPPPAGQTTMFQTLRPSKQGRIISSKELAHHRDDNTPPVVMPPPTGHPKRFQLLQPSRKGRSISKKRSHAQSAIMSPPPRGQSSLFRDSQPSTGIDFIPDQIGRIEINQGTDAIAPGAYSVFPSIATGSGGSVTRTSLSSLVAAAPMDNTNENYETNLFAIEAQRIKENDVVLQAEATFWHGRRGVRFLLLLLVGILLVALVVGLILGMLPRSTTPVAEAPDPAPPAAQTPAEIACSFLSLTNLTECQAATVYKFENGKLGPTIPTEIMTLTNLTDLDLSSGGLTGYIPSEIAQLTSLSRLDLSYNGLIGHVPSTMAQLSNLKRLWLHNNSLIGSVPYSLCQQKAEIGIDCYDVECSCCQGWIARNFTSCPS